MDYKWEKNEIKDIYWAVILIQVKYDGDMDWSGKHEGSWKWLDSGYILKT